MPHIEHPLGWPGVTKVLSDFNNGWLKYMYKKHGTYEKAEKVAAMGRDRGTRIHAAFDALLRDIPIDIALEKVNPPEELVVRALDKWIIDRELKIILTDETGEVENKDHRYHGCIDLLAKLNTFNLPKTDYFNNYVEYPEYTRFIVDLKTQDNRKVTGDEIKKHSMQQAAYNECLEIPCDYGLVLNADIATGEVQEVVIHPLRAYFRPFLLQRDLYNYIHSENMWEHLRRRKKVG